MSRLSDHRWRLALHAFAAGEDADLRKFDEISNPGAQHDQE
jgi:hypothetical protein